MVRYNPTLWHLICGKRRTYQSLVVMPMSVFCTHGDRRHCLITATVVLFSMAGFLWVLELGGYIAAACLFALVVGLSVRYRL